MANTTLTLKSGKTLELQVCSFDDATDFSDIVATELLKVDASFKLSDLKSIGGRDAGELVKVFLILIKSKELRKQIFKVAAGCIYDGQRITKQTFEPIEARPDWLPVALEVSKFVLLPFFENLASLLLPPNPEPAKGAQPSG